MIKRIAIVGGGSAGWMTATTLVKNFKDIEITLIESPNISTVGVGESTIAQFKNWLNLVNINEKDFLKETDGIIKLSIRFTDFYKKGEYFDYPFGLPVFKDAVFGVEDWWVKKELYNLDPKDFAKTYYPLITCVEENKFSYDIYDKLQLGKTGNSAVHFDAVKFALWLKEKICLPNGVKHVLQNIDDLQIDENGIKKLNNIEADLFIDCTGFNSILLNKFNINFESYEHLLPNNSAWATKLPYTDKEKELRPFTNCTALNCGWVWNIPLWSRMGTGYVYSDKFISDEDALLEFQNHIKTKELDFKKIKMRVGIFNKLWHKNVVAIGLSAGFIEPLESNGLFSVHEFLYELCRSLRRREITQIEKDSFNINCKKVFKNFAEFVCLHYSLSVRDDTPYWRHVTNKEVLTVNNDIDSDFISLVNNKRDHLRFHPGSGISCISAGYNYAPLDMYAIKYKLNLNETSILSALDKSFSSMENSKNTYYNVVKDYPSYYHFIKNTYYET
jgi:hypothetical protein